MKQKIKIWIKNVGHGGYIKASLWEAYSTLHKTVKITATFIRISYLEPVICATLLSGKGIALRSRLMVDSVGRDLDPNIRAMGTSSAIKRRFGHFDT